MMDLQVGMEFAVRPDLWGGLPYPRKLVRVGLDVAWKCKLPRFSSFEDDITRSATYSSVVNHIESGAWVRIWPHEIAVPEGL